MLMLHLQQYEHFLKNNSLKRLGFSGNYSSTSNLEHDIMYVNVIVVNSIKKYIFPYLYACHGKLNGKM